MNWLLQARIPAALRCMYQRALAHRVTTPTNTRQVRDVICISCECIRPYVFHSSVLVPFHLSGCMHCDIFLDFDVHLILYCHVCACVHLTLCMCALCTCALGMRVSVSVSLCTRMRALCICVTLCVHACMLVCDSRDSHSLSVRFIATSPLRC